MKKGFIVFLVAVFLMPAYGQKKNISVRNVIETEMAFAKAAEEKGTKAAFLEFLDDDGIIFKPQEKNGKAYWGRRPESNEILSWRPAWADLSSTGDFGYTTGPWEYRADKKDEKPAAFGEYLTLWKAQPDGKFKAVLDVGISHEKPKTSAGEWRSPADAGKGEKNPKNGFEGNAVTSIFSAMNLVESYKPYLADDVYLLRDEMFPAAGKVRFLEEMAILQRKYPRSSSLNLNTNLSKRYGNLQYAHGVYELTHKDKSVEKWNFVQIWKYREGKWQLVLDVFSLIRKE